MNLQEVQPDVSTVYKIFPFVRSNKDIRDQMGLSRALVSCVL